MGLLAALVMPVLGSRSAGRAKISAYELVTLLRDARIAARVGRRTHIVRLTEHPGHWQAAVFTVDDAGREEPVEDDRWALAVRIPPVVSFRRTSPDGVPSPLTEKVVRFSPVGSAENCLIELDTGGQKAPLAIEVRAPSGLVSLDGADPAAGATEDPTGAIEAYWEAHYRQVSP